MDIFSGIDELIIYAKNNLLLDELDEVNARNNVLAILGLEEYHAGKPNESKVDKMTTPDKLMSEFLDACIMGKIVIEKDREKIGNKILTALSKMPSDVNDLYYELGGKGNAKADAFIADYAKASKFGSSFNPAFTEEITDDGFIVKATGEGKEELALLYLTVDELIAYAIDNLLLDEYDADYVKRNILDEIHVDTYAPQEVDYDKIELADRPDALLFTFKDAAIGAGVLKAEDSARVLNAVMGYLSVKPSEINDLFADLGGKKAMDFLYDYSVKNYSVKKTAIEANPRFKAGYTKGGLEITINKTRPEYTDTKKAAAGNTPAGGYPKCSICYDNEGFSGTAKANLRTASIELDGEEWFWQFSPYGYLGKHGIAVSKEHKPMKVTEKTVRALMDFVDKFPQLFIGCNAALPGAGGSVLSHDHFQGGEEVLPMHKANGAVKLEYPKYPLAEIFVLDWYDSAIRVTSQSKQVMTEIAEDIRTGWENYSNPALGILAKDADGQCNAVSYTMRKLGNGRYCLDVILRSNVKSDEYPDGVFHTHPEFQVLKKEANGLLEAQGLFILPGRVEDEMKALNDVLANKEKLPKELESYKLLYNEIVKENGKDMSKVEAGIYIKAEFGSVCERILENIAVFKTADETANFLVGLGKFKKI